MINPLFGARYVQFTQGPHPAEGSGQESPLDRWKRDHDLHGEPMGADMWLILTSRENSELEAAIASSTDQGSLQELRASSQVVNALKAKAEQHSTIELNPFEDLSDEVLAELLSGD